MGAANFALIVQSGNRPFLKVGNQKDKNVTAFQMILDQSDPEQKVSMIEYSWRSYESDLAQMIFYKFQFKSKDGRVLGTV